MGQPAKVDVEAPVPEKAVAVEAPVSVLKRSPTLRTRDTVGLRDALLARKAKKLQATRLGFLCLYVTLLFGVWILALRHNRISLYELEYSPSRPVWKSKFHGAFRLIYAQVTAARRRAQGLRPGGQARERGQGAPQDSFILSSLRFDTNAQRQA